MGCARALAAPFSRPDFGGAPELLPVCQSLLSDGGEAAG